KECFKRARAQCFPNLDHLISDDGGKTHSHPNTCRFNRQTKPCFNMQPYQDARTVFPPTVRQGQRDFPEQADEEKKKKCKTKSAPVDEALRGVKKAGRWNERRKDEINEIPRE